MDWTQYLNMFLILVGVLFVVTIFVLLIEKLSNKKVNKETTVYGEDESLETISENNTLPKTCGSGACSSCSFKLVECKTSTNKTK